MSDSPVVKQKKDGTKKADAQPAPRVLRPERVSYRVQRDEPPSYAVMLLEGPDAGKYRDERTGVVYETSSDWIRAMNTSIPLGM